MTEREILLALRRVSRQLRDLPQRLEQREREVTESDDLTGEQKRIRIRQIREEERAKHRRLSAEMTKLGQRAEKVASEKALAGGRRETHQRVRELLRANVPASEIISRAEGLGDSDTIRALRAEVLYLGNRDGWADARETITACNRALADLGHLEEDALVEIEKVRKPLAVIDEFAGKSVIGQVTAHDRLTLGYAVSGEEDDDA